MNYTELLNRFWGMDREFTCIERLLYLYLLHRCNELGWPDTFSISSEEILQVLKCARNTMRSARITLVESGLIQFKARFGRGECSFYSIVAEKTKKGQSETPFIEEKGSMGDPFSEKKGQWETPFISATTSKPNEKTKKGQSETPFSAQLKTEEKKQRKKKPLPAPTEKEKNKEKKKENTRSILGACAHTREGDDGQIEIVFKEIEPKPLKKKREPREPILPDNIQEVISFFEKNGRELQDWRADAEAFFYHFDSVGWMGTSNRKIIDWKSRAHLWIADKIVKEKQKSVNNGTTTINPTGSTRESRLAEAEELVDSLLREGGIG